LAGAILKVWDIHPRERGCSIKLLHYNNNKNEVTVQVVIFDRHNEKNKKSSGDKLLSFNFPLLSASPF